MKLLRVLSCIGLLLPLQAIAVSDFTAQIGGGYPFRLISSTEKMVESHAETFNGNVAKKAKGGSFNVGGTFLANRGSEANWSSFAVDGAYTFHGTGAFKVENISGIGGQLIEQEFKTKLHEIRIVPGLFTAGDVAFFFGGGLHYTGVKFEQDASDNSGNELELNNFDSGIHLIGLAKVLFGPDGGLGFEASITNLNFYIGAFIHIGY